MREVHVAVVAVGAMVLGVLSSNPAFTRECDSGSAYVFELNCDVICAGDVDGDGTTGASDLAVILDNWGPVPPGDPIADLTGDGIVGPADLAIVLGTWGECP